MKRLLLSLICCSPLLFSPSVSFSIGLTGPSEESPLSFEQYGPINPSETLWAISTKLRPDDSVTVQQTMVAIYKSNPYVFYNGDINKIIPESILKVPSLDFIKQQTNAEAIQLIQRFTAQKKSTAKPKVVEPAKAEIEKAPKVETVEVKTVPIDADIIAQSELNKEKALAAEQKLAELQAEMDMLNEQYIVATESTQALKMKLQPLNDQIATLTEQLAAEMTIQKQLQQVIDDYRAQLAAIVPAPFSGDGMLDKILHFITSSLTNLLIVIFAPIILLLLLYAVISRIQSKRELEEKERELAESTAILMEESGQFDALLTDDISDSEEEEIDFSANELNAEQAPENTDLDELIIPDDLDAIDLTDDESLDIVDLTEDDDPVTAVDLDEDELQTSEDDPFGISALTADDTLTSAVDLADAELETSEDDPFGIGALTEDDALNSSVDLSEDETAEDDPFGIGALTDDVEVSAESAPISASEQADLDLAAEWEAQVSADSQGEDNSSVDIDELLTPEIAEDEAGASISPDDIDELLTPEITEDEADLNISSDDIDDLLTAEVTEDADSSVDVEDLFTTDATQQQETDPAADSINAVEEPLLDISESEDALDPFNLDELETLSEELSKEPQLAAVEEELAALETDELTLADIEDDNDLLAQQISDVAFNEEVSLPEVGDAKENDFIDIETLLENSESTDKDEPYSELELDLGLEEFPDVVERQENIDIDDDENGIGAQLDLARAYLEIDDKEGAKEILMAVVEESNGKQRQEIDKLLSRLG